MTPVPQVFRGLALLYLVTNARYGSGLGRKRLQRVMTRPEREAITAVLERLPATIRDWSDGLATLQPLDIVEVRRQLGSLSSSGAGRWWAGPRDCREELLELVSDHPYDSVIVLWPAAPEVPLCGWGCSVGPSEATFGAGFSSIPSDHWPTLASAPDPEQGYVHEWLHQVESIYRALGVGESELPGLHDAAQFTSTRATNEPPFGQSYATYHDGQPGSGGPGGEAGPPRAASATWAPWYRDWMTGRLRRIPEATTADAAEVDLTTTDPARPTDGPIGLTSERWALRSQKRI